MQDVAQWLAESTVVFVMLLVGLGLIVGSFLNVVIHRLPIMLERQWWQQAREVLHPEQPQAAHETFNLAVPHSHCPQCKAPVKPWQNIPVVSYLLLRGQCGSCKARISIRYPLVELLTALLTLAVGMVFGPTLMALCYAALVWALIALALIDVDTQLLPDDITLPLLWAGLIANALFRWVPLAESLWGAVAGYLLLWSVYWLFKLVTGKEGMGYGDFKLLAALGAWLGWTMLPLIILLASVSGTVISVLVMVLKKQSTEQPVPFGPYLALGGLAALFFGEALIDLYWQFSGI